MDRRIVFRRLEGSQANFGLVADYLSRRAPFDRFPLGQFCQSLRYQLTRAAHVAAFDGETLCGYLGWLPTTRAVGEAWRRNGGTLTPVEDAGHDAAALTVVCVDERVLLLPIIRQARRLNPGRRIYFKRTYADAARAERKATVANFVAQG